MESEWHPFQEILLCITFHWEGTLNLLEVLRGTMHKGNVSPACHHDKEHQSNHCIQCTWDEGSRFVAGLPGFPWGATKKGQVTSELSWTQIMTRNRPLKLGCHGSLDPAQESQTLYYVSTSWWLPKYPRSLFWLDSREPCNSDNLQPLINCGSPRLWQELSLETLQHLTMSPHCTCLLESSLWDEVAKMLPHATRDH